jgi:aspartyl-tRNA(Asn)/glutamyl-tRNA(Gln) amidotransferase subunit A
MSVSLRLSDVRTALRLGHITPTELVEECLARAGDAFSYVDVVGARRQAAELMHRPRGSRGLLWGIPVAIKDLVDVAGLPTGGGRLTGPVASTDAPLVARLRELDAMIIGKTRTDELGLATFTPGVANPYDPLRSVGGSSGGSAAAVAQGAAVLAVATDTAGSARIPAAACGVVGLCAAPDWYPGGAIGLSPTFDRRGLIAADAMSLETAWRELSGAGSVVVGSPGRVLVFEPEVVGQVDDARRDAVAEAAAALGGASVVLDAPRLSDFGSPRSIVITADAAARYAPGQVETPVVRHELLGGTRYSPERVEAARAELARLGAKVRSCLGDGGVLLLPTLPDAPPRWADLVSVDDQLIAIGRMTRLCGVANSSGLVAVSVPWTRDRSGQPVAVQVITSSTARALSTAVALESAAPGGLN